MDEITREQFEEYKRCQELGHFNMFDYRSWKSFTTLTKDQWIEIITHYNELSKKYN